MAEANPQVMQMIESELKQNPDISNSELLEKATDIDKSVEKLSARQFNATYPLQVKRALKPKKPSTGRAKRASKPRAKAARSSSGTGREQVRRVLLDLARDVANAQGKGDVVDVVAGIDGYVDRVVEAAG